MGTSFNTLGLLMVAGVVLLAYFGFIHISLSTILILAVILGGLSCIFTKLKR